VITKAIFFGTVLGIVAGVASWVAWGDRFLSDDQATDLREMVLRQEFEYVKSHGHQVGQVFFVLIHSRNPDEAFLKRFDGSGWTVRPGSHYAKGTGTFCYLDSFERLDDDAVEIGGGFRNGKKPSWRYTCRLEWHWGDWRIVEEKAVPVPE
jgi:hypothetical protein